MDQQDETRTAETFKKRRLSGRAITIKLSLSAMMIALAVVCNYATKFLPLRMPQGGSVTIECLPLVIAGLFLGPVYGGITGAIYGLVDLMIGGVLYHWASLFLDYVLAFGLLGMAAGFFRRPYYRNRLYSIFAATAAGFFLRYICSSLSGVLLFPSYAGDKNVFLYSFILYNLPYMAASAGVTAVLLGVTYIPLQRQTRLLESWLR